MEFVLSVSWPCRRRQGAAMFWETTKSHGFASSLPSAQLSRNKVTLFNHKKGGQPNRKRQESFIIIPIYRHALLNAGLVVKAGLEVLHSCFELRCYLKGHWVRLMDVKAFPIYCEVQVKNETGKEELAAFQ